MSNRRSPTGMPTDTIRKEVRRSMVRHNSRRGREAQCAETPRQPAQPKQDSPLRWFSPPPRAVGRSSRRSVPGSAVRFRTRRSAQVLPWPPNRRAAGVSARGLPAIGTLFFREDLCNQRSRRRAGDKFRQPADANCRKVAPGFDAVVTIPTGRSARETARPGRAAGLHLQGLEGRSQDMGSRL